MQDKGSKERSEEPISKLHTIGAGFCGTVWASSERGSAYKREDGGEFRSLQNDYNMHQRVLQSLRKFEGLDQVSHAMSPEIQVPDCRRFITADSDWWASNKQAFPSRYTACNVLESQRIPPFPGRTRSLLVHKYCPPQMVDDIMESEANKDCLIRPYLGRHRRWSEFRTFSQIQVFSLRNFPLHASQMDELDIPLEDRQHYARIMARTLAIMHWIGNIDGGDIEFVLAPPNENSRRSVDIILNCLGEHSVWVLDFDCCKDMSVDDAGVRRAVTAFWQNDPFYPRPIREPLLWAAFRVEYLQSSEVATRLYDRAEAVKRRALSKLFIDLVEDQACGRYGKTITCTENEKYVVA
ncbi:hypothetical protein PEBR_35498 [Penicillium brasilianum]|uniref:DUF3669 domain-containing protein n=1 Tax=Penicillium brasilianum TaxID=104259 RepID=A0A1S9RE59_PENBI|nr:hypothetical protein PEBR_35498 [Penicillium brasilianum]